ncbi:hypothetical protein VKT23_010707 [Stygiomarasmius scandens]|uniref:Uncharacterized protein n=1 Tax=Marasmiellus scandens TaxID=2682957 RepID=A0ABR1JDP7_9AGAR
MNYMIIDCIWHPSNADDFYTHLRLLKNNLKSHHYKTSFGKNTLGGSTQWKFLFDHNTTYSIEIYMSSRNAPGARRVGIVPSKYDFREIRLEDLENSRDIECHNYVLACDIQMSFGKITIHLLRNPIGITSEETFGSQLASLYSCPYPPSLHTQDLYVSSSTSSTSTTNSHNTSNHHNHSSNNVNSNIYNISTHINIVSSNITGLPGCMPDYATNWSSWPESDAHEPVYESMYRLGLIPAVSVCT